MVMLRNIMEGKYSFSSPEWADISESPKDLIRQLLVVDPDKRISIQGALSHPFFNVMVSNNCYFLLTQIIVFFIKKKLYSLFQLFDQDIAPLKKSLSASSRRISKISQMAKVIEIFIYFLFY